MCCRLLVYLVRIIRIAAIIFLKTTKLRLYKVAQFFHMFLRIFDLMTFYIRSLLFFTTTFLILREIKMSRLFSLLFILVSVLMQATVAEGHVNSIALNKMKKETREALDEEHRAREVERVPIVIRVTGYSAFAKKEDVKSEPKRLMALRASKLDAYRALAERVYGTSVAGTSTVQDFALKHDGFGMVVDSFVRGARVVSISENKGLGFETVLELLLPGNFQDCLTSINLFRHDTQCLQPLPRLNNVSAYEPSSTGKKAKAPNTMGRVYYLQ